MHPQNFVQAIRALRRSPGFAAATMLTLALGIGATAAVFSVVDNALLRPLPYAQAHRLVTIVDVNRTGFGGGVVLAKLPSYRAARSFDGLAGFERMSRALTGSGVPEQVLGEAVTTNLFTLVGVPAAIGRTFQAGDVRAVILTDGLWRRRFGADASIVGRTIVLNDVTYEVIGVMPPAFEPLSQRGSGFRIDFFLPELVDRAPAAPPKQINVVGRLAPDVSIAQAQAELQGLSSERELLPVVAPLRDRAFRGQMRMSLLLMFAAVALVLLIACVNLGNLFVVHTIGRQREIATRVAIGATRREIAIDFAARGLVIGALGGALGLALGVWIHSVLVAMAPITVPGIDQAALNLRFVLFTAVTSLVAGVAASCLPLLSISHRDVAAVIASIGRSTTGSRSTARWRGVLMCVEIGAAMALTVGAALLVRSQIALNEIEIGFRTDHVLMFTVRLPETRFADSSARLAFFEDLERRIGNVSAVRSVTFTDALPARGGRRMTIGTPDAEQVAVDFQVVSPGYFEVLRIPIVRGRGFDQRDRGGAAPVAIVSETLVRRTFGSRDPIGERLILASPLPPATIVGVVGEIMRDGPAARLAPQVYVPAAQSGDNTDRLAEVGVLADGDPLALVPEMQRLVASIDANLPITHARKLDDILDGATAPRRFNLLLLGALAMLAVTLALVGVYGVVAHAATERRKEIGIRIALGARRGHVIAVVASTSLAWAIAGVTIGSIAAYAGSRFITSLLFGVAPTDPLAFASSIACVLLVCLVAALIPARRAAAADPIHTLRID